MNWTIIYSDHFDPEEDRSLITIDYQDSIRPTKSNIHSII
jgi:hypothetical protein